MFAGPPYPLSVDKPRVPAANPGEIVGKLLAHISQFIDIVATLIYTKLLVQIRRSDITYFI